MRLNTVNTVNTIISLSSFQGKYYFPTIVVAPWLHCTSSDESYNYTLFCTVQYNSNTCLLQVVTMMVGLCELAEDSTDAKAVINWTNAFVNDYFIDAWIKASGGWVSIPLSPSINF